MTSLEIIGLTASYGRIRALNEVSLAARSGEVTVLLGANGAGKTTTLRAICGMVRTNGQVLLDGEPIAGRRPDWIARRGVAHVAQGRGTFAALTVDENLSAGAFRIRGQRQQTRARREEVFELFPRLRDRIAQRAGSLSGGEQQMLAIGRALMMQPRILLLDEPSLGLAPAIVESLYDSLRSVNVSTGTTMLIVEQNAQLAFEIAQFAYVLETGSLVASGPADELKAHDAIRTAYLGY